MTLPKRFLSFNQVITLSLEQDEDPWLGSLLNFPTVLHARALLSHEVSNSSLQKIIVQSLKSLAALSLPLDLSLSGHEGYLKGTVRFKIGVGNADAFDTFDTKEAERLLKRIEQKGPFTTLDLAFNAHYSAPDRARHTTRGDRFLARLLFRPSRVEICIHHLKGIRRIQPGDIISLLVEHADAALEKIGCSPLQAESLEGARSSPVEFSSV